MGVPRTMKRFSRWAKWIILPTVALAAIGFAIWEFAGPSARALLASIGDFLQGLWIRPLLSVGSFRLTAALVTQAAVFLVILWFGTRIASRLLRTKVLDRTDLDEGLKFSVQRVSAYMLFAFGALNLLHLLGVDLGSLAVFSGALGIGLGLGFQTIAKNFASGLILLLEQPIKVGDRVQVGDLLGDIVNIGARGAWVRTNDNVVMIVPNSEFIEGRVTNWTANDRKVRITIRFGVSYSSAPEHVQDVTLRLAGEHPDVLKDPGPNVIFTGFGDSSLDFALRVWTSKQVTTPRSFSSDLYFKLFAALKAEGIEIPFPQRDLHLRSAPATMRVATLAPSDGTELARNLDGPASAQPSVKTEQ